MSSPRVVPLGVFLGLAALLPGVAQAQNGPQATSPTATASPTNASPTNASPRVPALTRVAQASDTGRAVSGSAVAGAAASSEPGPATIAVPVVRAVGAPPGVPLVSHRKVPLSTRERRGVDLSQQWMAGSDTRDMPTHGAEGAVLFTFGATLPTVVCAPLYVCDMALQPGETVTNLTAGDRVQWDFVPAESGTGDDKTTHVVIKPHDAGLTTNVVITTDRRTYRVKMVSTPRDWMPSVAFRYPDDQQREWAAYRARTASAADAATRAARGTLPTVGTSGATAVADVTSLNFDFRLEGDRPAWRPVRVYTDGAHTYIQFPPTVASGEAPALVALSADGEEQVVNYRMVGDRMVADKVLDRAALVAGVGKHQQRVEIVRVGGR